MHIKKRKKILDLFKKQKHEKFIVESSKWLEELPIDIEIFFARAMAFSELGLFKEQIRSYTTYLGLVDSILMSGDGKTVETAFWVTTIEEEYAVIGEFRLQRISQALLEGGIDKIDCQTSDGKQVTLYFDVSDVMKKLKI